MNEWFNHLHFHAEKLELEAGILVKEVSDTYSPVLVSCISNHACRKFSTQFCYFGDFFL